MAPVTKFKISARMAPAELQWPYAKAVNGTGTICGFAFPADWQQPALPVQWVSGVGQIIPVPGNAGAAYDVNDAGDVVGYAGSFLPEHYAFLFRNGTPTLLAGLPGPYSWATSINNHGTIAGTCGPADASRVFVYDSNAHVTLIEPLRDHTCTSHGYINDAGEVVGISSRAGGEDSHLFVWQNGSMQDIDTVTDVRGANDKGLIVGTRGPQGAFRYEPGVGFKACAPAGGSQGNGINSSGDVVGWYWKSNAPADPAPFVNVDGGFQDLESAVVDLTEWFALFTADAINDDGIIVGQGVLNAGDVAVFVLEPQPVHLRNDALRWLMLIGALTVDGGGIAVPVGGGPPVPVPPRGMDQLSPAERDLAVGHLAARLASTVSNERLGREMRDVALRLISASTGELGKTTR